MFDEYQLSKARGGRGSVENKACVNLHMSRRCGRVPRRSSLLEQRIRFAMLLCLVQHYAMEQEELCSTMMAECDSYENA